MPSRSRSVIAAERRDRRPGVERAALAAIVDREVVVGAEHRPHPVLLAGGGERLPVVPGHVLLALDHQADLHRRSSFGFGGHRFHGLPTRLWPQLREGLEARRGALDQRRPPLGSRAPAGRARPRHRAPRRLVDHLRHRHPGLDQGEVGLGVEEDAPGVAGAEGLALGPGRRGELLGAVGQVEDVAVPVQDFGARGESAEQRVGGVADLDRGEADLRRLPRPHLRPERPRQQLGAEADAEHRHPALHRLGQPLALGGQRREALDLVDVHRPAHDDGARDLVVPGQRMARQRFDRLHAKSAAGVEDPVRPLPGHVLDRQQGRTLVHAHRNLRLASLRLARWQAARHSPPPAAGQDRRNQRRRGPRRPCDRRARRGRRRNRRLRDRPPQHRPPGDRQRDDRPASRSSSSRSRSWRSARLTVRESLRAPGMS